MKNIFLIFIALLCGGFSYAQNSNSMEFIYDASGNRTSRTIPVVQTRSSQEDISQEKVLDYNITVYPNPTSGDLNLTITGKPIDDRTELSVYSSTGALIYKAKVRGESNHIDLTNQLDRIYILRLIIDGQAITWKIVKK